MVQKRETSRMGSLLGVGPGGEGMRRSFMERRLTHRKVMGVTGVGK